MKKIMLLTMAILIILPVQSHAQTTKSDNVTIHYFTYDSSRDQYILDYTLSDYANAVVTIFVTPTGTTYTKKWGSWTVNRRIFHNCNGTFNYNFTVGDRVVGYIEGLEATQIQDPVCEQQIPGEDYSDTNPRVTEREDGGKRIYYEENNGGNGTGGGNGYDPKGYRLERSTDGGQTWNEYGYNDRDLTDGSTGYFDVPNTGYYRLITVDQNDNDITTDYIGESEFENIKCDGCKTLTEMLACPAWEDYLGDLANVISDSIPPPPDINASIDYLIDELKNQEVTPQEPVTPPAFDPGYEEQQIDLPEPIEVDLNPDPNDFELEIGGDGSGSVNITDPTSWVPDNTDTGYNPPDPESDTPPTYQETETEPDTPPSYEPPETEPDTPPSYEPSETITDEIPEYQTGNESNNEIPEYSTGNENGNDIPEYNYQ